MIVILNYSRSGGTLLGRIIGTLPDVVLASEINPEAGISIDNVLTESYIALKDQMQKWYDITLGGDQFLSTLENLYEYCKLNQKKLVLRDWTYYNFRKGEHNKYDPSYRFAIVDEVKKLGTPTVFAFVRNAIDVFLSSGGDLNDFAEDYLKYVEALKRENITIIKYEDLVKKPDRTIYNICNICGLEYSNSYQFFSGNYKCTGDTQLGKASRGLRSQSIVSLPRVRVKGKIIRHINTCKNIIEANRLLEYAPNYWDSCVETRMGMLQRKFMSKFYRIIS